MTEEHEKLTQAYNLLVEALRDEPVSPAWVWRALRHILYRLGPPDAMAEPDAEVRRAFDGGPFAMKSETLPADIAAAIDLVVRTQHACVRDLRKPVSTADVKRSMAAGAAIDVLSMTILRHLTDRVEA